MQIHVKTLTGKTLSIECELTWSIDDFKRVVQERTNVSIEKQRLVYSANQELKSGRMLADYFHPESNCVVRLHQRANLQALQNQIQSIICSTLNDYDQFCFFKNP